MYDESGYLITVKDKTSDPSSSVQENITTRSKYAELKIWISDLLTIKQHPNGVGQLQCYYFHNYLVNIVDIYGVVTGYSTNRFGVLYKVDDGTGEIGCWLDNRRLIKREDVANAVEKSISWVEHKHSERKCYDSIRSMSLSMDESLLVEQASASAAVLKVSEWMKNKINKKIESQRDDLNRFSVGDTVHVRGKLNDFREERCIRVYDIRLVADVQEELDRRFELIFLYEKMYNISVGS